MAKHPPTLVSQYLERISREALEEHQSVIREFVRNRHGVYALYKGERLYYVGLATNLRVRLRHHLQDRHGSSWDYFSVYLTIGGDHLRDLESLVIRIAGPKGNSLKGGFRRAENLRSAFARSMKDFYRKKIAGLVSWSGRKAPKPRLKSADGISLAPYVKRPFRIRFLYKGKTYWARVRNDGQIRYAGRLYATPSAPAVKICGGNAANGWKAWQYERAPSDWVPLGVMRR